MVLRTADGRRFSMSHLLRMVQNELGLTQLELGHKLGVSRRTIIRWSVNSTRPAPFQVEELAALVRAEGNDDLADSLLEAEDLPLPQPRVELPAPRVVVEPPPPAGPAPQHALDAVIYAASDAADLAPRTARIVLRAALQRAKELGVSADAIVEALVTI
jgi:DNA-binding XRE family transcriptional regulator